MRLPWLWAGLAVLCVSPGLWAEPPAATKTGEFSVPYRLTETKHILVRAKLNGKGPFHFILDTGAPAVYVSTAVCKKLGVEPDREGWGTLDRFQLEGGLSVTKQRVRVEDPFQLKGMNGMGLAGVELHGVIGYTLLARYKVEIDVTRDKMVWTALDFKPPAVIGLGKAGSPAGVEAMATLVQVATRLMGNRGMPLTVARGFLGVELEDGKAVEDGVRVKAVLPGTPAAKAGLRAGDRIRAFDGREVVSVSEVQERAKELTAGQKVELRVVRGGKETPVTIRAGEGL